MTPKYARNQPSGFTNRVERVAIVGAAGLIGQHFTQALLQTGKHTITALTRSDSHAKLPEGVKVAQIDYNDESSLVSALHDQHCLIITLSVRAPPDTHSKLVQAAAKAGVAYIMPNYYSIDILNTSLSTDILTGDQARADFVEIEATGVSAGTPLVCGMWYEYSLISGPEWFGFNFPAKKLTLYDDGTTKTNITTWEQCGRAVAAWLSLKELPEDEHDQSPTVSTWANKPLYISSFFLNQKDMFESWKRVTGDRDEDWTIEHESTVERRKRGLELLKTGDRKGFGLAVFSRIFYPNGDGDYEHEHGLANEVLGLPREDLDERTRVAKEVLDSGYSYLTRS